MSAATNNRQFYVRASHIDHHHARLVSETSFEAAAVAYVEDFGHPAGDEPEIRVIVRDLDSGLQHCFLIDLDTGATGPCR